MDNNTCNKTSNNKYFDCPALMSDGRAFTDYRPSSYTNDLIRIQNGVYDSYQYRQFLISNAEKLMKVNDEYNFMKNGCASCTYQQIPNESTCVYNKHYGLCYPNGCNGLGQNNYATKNMKKDHLDYGLQETLPGNGLPNQRNCN